MLIINSNYNQKTNFTGLTSYFQKTIFSPGDVKKLTTEIFKNSFVGNLPSEWIEKIPKQQRAQTIKEVFHGFRKFVQLINEEPATALSHLEKTLKTAGILPVDKGIKLKFEGAGAYGKVYRLEGLENKKTSEQYVIKIYNQKGNNAKNNGILPELNRGGFYWPKAAGRNTQMVKTFFGDLESGFAVNKFIDDSVKCPKKIIPSKLVGLESYDDLPKQDLSNGLYSLNVINRYVVDHGCLRITCPEIINSKEAKYVMKKVFSAPRDKAFDEWLKLLNNPAYKHNSNVRIALIEALEYLQPTDIAKGFNEVLERFNKSQQVKHYLAKNIKFIQDKDFNLCFAKLWGQSDLPEKIELIKNIDRLPPKVQNHYISEALKEKMPFSGLADKFDNLTVEERIPFYNSAINASDDKNKVELFEKLFLLPKELRLKYAKKILQNLKGTDNLSKIEEKSFLLGLNSLQDYKKVYEYLITDARDTTKLFIINKILKKLSFEDYVQAFKALAKDSSEAIKFKLAPFFEETAQNKKINKEDLNFIYNELIKNTNNQNYLEYTKKSFKI